MGGGDARRAARAARRGGGRGWPRRRPPGGEGVRGGGQRGEGGEGGSMELVAPRDRRAARSPSPSWPCASAWLSPRGMPHAKIFGNGVPACRRTARLEEFKREQKNHVPQKQQISGIRRVHSQRAHNQCLLPSLFQPSVARGGFSATVTFSLLEFFLRAHDIVFNGQIMRTCAPFMLRFLCVLRGWHRGHCESHWGSDSGHKLPLKDS